MLCLPLLWQLARFRVSSELRVLLAGDRRNLESYEKVRQMLTNVEVLVLSLEVPEVFSPSGLDAVRRVSNAFVQEPDVTDVKSLTHSSIPVRHGLSFDMVPFVPEKPLSAEKLKKLKTFSLTHPLVRNLMVAGDSKHTIILVTYQRDLDTPARQRAWRQEIDRVLRPFRQEGLRFQMLALPLVEEEVRATLRSDVKLMFPAALSLLAIILWFTFRSWRYLVLVLANQAVVLLMLPGLVQGLGFSLTVFSVMLLPLLTGVHLTLLAHVYTAFQRALGEGATGRAAIELMLHQVFKSCAFAAITTVAGLGSLMLSEVRQVQEFGLLGSLGLALVFFMTFGPGLALMQLAAPYLPALPTAAKPGAQPPVSPVDWRSGWPGRLTCFIGGQAKVIMVVALLAVVAGIFGVRRIRTDIRAVEFLNPHSPTRRAAEMLDQIYGGINVVQIEFDSGAKGGVNNPEFLRYIDRVQRYAEARSEVSGVYSYAQLMAMMNQIWEGGQPEAMTLPKNPLLLNFFALALQSQDYPFLTALADPTLRTAYLVMRTRDMPAERYLNLLHKVVDFAKTNKPPAVKVSATAGIHSILEADRRIVRSQVQTAGVAAVVIGLVLALLWRSPVLALFALLTNAIPVGLVMAVAGFATLPLNSITVMVAAIALGIAVDDSVHFVTYWREARARGLASPEALSATFRVKGRPIIATSAALIAIFSLFALSSFPPVVHFGVLCAVAFAGALIAVLVLLPALLWRFPRAGLR